MLGIKVFIMFNTIISLYHYLFKQCHKHAPQNTLQDIITAMAQPAKDKTVTQIVNDYVAFVTMAELQLSYLASDPALMFHGTHADTVHIPCMVRPDVIYCCLGNN